MNNIVTDLLNYALSQGINVHLEPDLGPNTPSFADSQTGSIFINTNNFRRKQLPFQTAHEIAHILNGDKSSHRLHFNSMYSEPKTELNANRKAIRMLIPYYADERSIDHISITQFMDYFEIPSHLEKAVIEEFQGYL